MATDGEKDLRVWVQDRLHGLLGYADSNVAAFLITIARKHTSAASLYTDLQRSCGLSSGTNVQTFAAELLERVPRKATNVPSVLQQQQRTARDMVRKNASYGLLDGDDDEPPPAPAPRGPGPAGPGPSSEREQKRQQSPQPAGGKHLRKKVQYNADDGKDDEDDTAIRQAKRAKRKWEQEEDEDRQQETDEQREERLR
jgi:pre-mRNA-splicing factor ATP-dependent RNA helicase DHX16